MVFRSLLAALLLCTPLPADAALRAFAQIDGSASWPLGAWKANASFPDQTHFSTGPGGRLALGWAPAESRYFTLGLEGSYAQVGTSSWESFTASRGGRVHADARMWSVMAGGTVALPGRGRGDFAVEFHGALGLLVPSGEEEYGGRIYRYDFLRTTLAGRVGARALWRFDEAWDLWAGGELLVAPGAVRYSAPLPSARAPLDRSQERRTLTALEPGLGLRYWFSL